MSSRSSVDRVPAQCLGGHGFDSCRGLRIFLCPTFVSCWLIHLHISLPSLKNSPSLLTYHNSKPHSICFFTTISMFFRAWTRVWHIDASSVVWTLIDNSKLANQIARLVAIVVKMFQFSTVSLPTSLRSEFSSLLCLWSAASLKCEFKMAAAEGKFVWLETLRKARKTSLVQDGKWCKPSKTE